MATRYLVGHNMVGYLPDSDPYYVRTKRAAIAASYSDAKMGRDEDSRFKLNGKAGDYWLDSDDPYTLSYHYWIHEMEAERCFCGTYPDVYCVNCGNHIYTGDPMWRVPENGDILCEDC